MVFLFDFLCALRASAVQSPSPASHESLKTLFIQCLEELLKRLKGALAELPQKLPIEGPDSGHVSLGNAAIF